MTLNLGTSDTVLTTAAASVVVTGPSDSFLLLKVTACNTDTAPRTVTAYRVPPAGTAAASNALVDGSGASAFIIQPGQTLVLPITGQGIIQGQSLQALADASSVVNLSATWTW